MNERERSVKSPHFHGLFLLLTCTDMRLTRGPSFLIYANNTSIPLPTFIGYLSCTRHYEASLNPHDNPVTQTLVPSLLVRKHSLRKGVPGPRPRAGRRLSQVLCRQAECRAHRSHSPRSPTCPLGPQVDSASSEHAPAQGSLVSIFSSLPGGLQAP